MIDPGKDNTCDFCSAVPSPWTYPASRGTDWGACPKCHETIQAGDRVALLERAVAAAPELQAALFSREERRAARKHVRAKVKDLHNDIFWRYCTTPPYYEPQLAMPAADGETQRSTL